MLALKEQDNVQGQIDLSVFSFGVFNSLFNYRRRKGGIKQDSDCK
jgi:hypothetical protein